VPTFLFDGRTHAAAADHFARQVRTEYMRCSPRMPGYADLLIPTQRRSPRGQCSAAKPGDSGNILPLSRCGIVQLMAKQ
jgi:hypothetical protein